MEPIIRVDRVVFQYDEQEEAAQEQLPALRGVSLDVYPGEFVAVLGHNGSGKSTLAKLLNALYVPTKGDVWVHGMNTREEERVFEIRKNVGMVFQNPDNQMVANIVEEDIAFGLENLGVEPPRIRSAVSEVLEIVGMTKYAQNAPHMLSGGQKQRIAIAGVVAMRPNVIVFDEPTAMLDPVGRAQVMETILRLNREFGITIILITHFMEEAAMAGRVVVMDAGKIAMQGTPHEVFAQVEPLHALGLDVPEPTELAYRLRVRGYDLPQDILTEQELKDALCRLL
jgi:energy-coupling factor transport system ATP-binding protein